MAPMTTAQQRSNIRKGAHLEQDADGTWSLLVGRQRFAAFWPTSKAIDHASDQHVPMLWLSGSITGFSADAVDNSAQRD